VKCEQSETLGPDTLLLTLPLIYPGKFLHFSEAQLPA
jgi:hypothetical protein